MTELMFFRVYVHLLYYDYRRASKHQSIRARIVLRYKYVKRYLMMNVVRVIRN